MKLRLPLILALFLTVEGHAQIRMTDSPRAGASSCVLTQRTKGRSLQRSVDDVDLRVMTRDPDGGVMVGGSVHMNDRKGLILRSNGKDLDGILIPRAMGVDDFAYITRDVGWRLYAGTLYGTSDGGACWREAFTHKGLTNIHFADRQNGWLTGLGGLIYRTDDAGASWRRQDSGTQLEVFEISSVDSLHAWALGKSLKSEFPSGKFQSALIATIDGGRTWQTLVTEETIALRTFTFVNGSEGWGIDRANNIVRTADGGRSWEVQRRGDKAVWRSIFFLNPREGWVGGDAIAHIRDGGATWKVQLQNERPEVPPIEALFFSDSQKGWAVTTQELLYTSNAGTTWNTIFNHPLITTAQR